MSNNNNIDTTGNKDTVDRNSKKTSMKEYISMVVVMTAIAAICGLLLSGVRQMTAAQIDKQIMENVKGPALKTVLESSTNEFTQDRQSITIDGQEHVVFIGKKDGNPWAIAFESSAAGFGGDIGIMVGFNLEKDELTGIGILTHSETPGLGARIVEPSFTSKFKGLPLSTVFKVKKDNGDIDALTGATYSSRGVCAAIVKSIDLYPRIKKQIIAGNKGK